MSIFSNDQDIIDLRRGNKYFDIALQLKQRIDCGEIASRLPSLPQICEEFSTTPVTAHKAVGLLKREGLVTSIKGKGTFVNRLKRVRKNVIDLILHTTGDENSELHNALIRGAQELAVTRNQHIMVHAHNANPVKALELIQDAWENNRADGFIFWPNETKAQNSAPLIYLKKHHIPFVLVPETVNKGYSDCHSVVTNQLNAVETMITRLVRKGHTRIAFVTSTEFSKHTTGKIRKKAYEHVMRQAGLPAGPCIVLEEISIAEIIPPLGDRSVLEAATAAFCVTDAHAVALIKFCLREGIRVPKDLELAGYNNGAFAKILGFHSVDQHFEKIGRKAVDLLLKEIEGGLDTPVNLNIQAEVVFR